MATDHIVDVLCHQGKVALEFLNRHEDVNVAFIVLDRHRIHFRNQTLQICAQGFNSLIDEGFFAGELLERGFEIALT